VPLAADQSTNLPPPEQSGTAAISGVVIDAQSGRPLSGAVVYLGVTGRGAIGRVSRRLTDAKGRFVFLNLPANDQYFINASRFGYVDGGYGRTPVRNAGTRIKLADGEWFKEARIPLWPPAAVNGRVLDERGEPVVGVPVRVLAQILVGGRPQVAAGPTAITDDRGAYRIAGLRPGKYVVQVPSVQSTVTAGTDPNINPRSAAPRSAPLAAIDLAGGVRYAVGDYATPPAAPRSLAYPITYHPAARTVAEAAAIDLNYGDDRQALDITLTPVPAARISGTVEGPSEAVSGLMLRLMPEGAEDMGTASEAATTIVDANGRFTFVGVAAGNYTIDARRTLAQFDVSSTAGSPPPLPTPPGFMFTGMTSASVASAPAGTSLSTRRASGAASYWSLTPVNVGSRDVDGVSVVMRRGATLTGSLVWEGRSGPPEQPRALPVWAEPANGNAVLGMPGSDFVRRELDRFTIEGLLPGRYTLRVIGQGTWQVKSIAWNGEDHTYTGFDATSGRDFENVVITLTDKGPRLSGTVRSGAGASAPGAVAIAFPVEREQWTGYGITPPRIRTAVADTSGEFRFTLLPAGEYFVAAVDEEEMYGWQDPKFLEQAQANGVRVAIGWGEAKTQDLRVVRVR